MQINNASFQKDANVSLVAQEIWRHSQISRADIARELHLYRSTVTNIIATLIESNVVYEGEAGSGFAKGGRKPITLRLNEQFGCILGFDIQPKHYRVVILNITGDTLWEGQGTLSFSVFEDALHLLMKEGLAQVNALGLPLLCACFGIPGIVDRDNGIIIHSESLKLHDFDMVKFFHEFYEVPLLVENDANCCAWLEMMLHRSEGLEDCICLIGDYHEENENLGISVGFGLSIGGKVYPGSNFAAGEFASLTWRGGEGQTGLPLDVLIRPERDEDAWMAVIEDLFSSLVPVVTILDPKVIYVHGKPFGDAERVRRSIQEVAPQFLLILERSGCRLEFNAQDDMVVAKGAAAMFLEKLFTVQELVEVDAKTHFGWSDVLKQASRPKGEYVKKPLEI